VTRGGENICEKVGQLQLHKVGIRGKLGEGGRSWGLVSMGMGIHAYGKYARAWGHVDI
jgi:hypothetical protein